MASQQKKPAKVVDVVSNDRNWVLRINGQLQAQKQWDGQWGYLSKGFSPDKTNIKPSIQNKIQQLQREVQQIDGSLYQTTSKAYGKGQKVEMFESKQNNIIENKQLRAMERKLPKGWKKQKWTPPPDPFDPLSNMGKKKK